MINKNTVVALATKHQKEMVLKKLFYKTLGINLVIPRGLDTDALGTFTGEIPRADTMENTAIKKARMGIEFTGLPCSLATEGSFGPHPYLALMPCHHEVMVYIDQEKNLMLFEKMFTYKTNFSFRDVKTIDEANGYLKQIDFPRHGLIVRPKNAKDSDLIFKGIQQLSDLAKSIKTCADYGEEGFARLETDMRAHMNPMRQSVIRQLAFRLIRKLRNNCPCCDTPGFGYVDRELGLPCSDCGSRTELVQYEIHGCIKCDYKQKARPRAGLMFANPQYCSYCNP